jgi:hypothetical protein
LERRNKLKIDTLKLKVTDVKAMEQKYYTYTRKEINGEIQEYYILNKYITGINSIVIFDNLTAIIQISSKILGKRHLEGITKDNIADVFLELKKYIDFDTSNTTVLRADVFSDIEVKNKKEYIKQLQLLNNISKYKIIEYYPEKSIIFEKDNKTAKDRIIFYDKEQELQDKINNAKDEEKKESLIKILEVEGIENLIRIELNINTFAKLRTLLKIQDLDLLTVLKSKENPIKNLINKYFMKDNPVNIANTEDEVYIKYYEAELQDHYCDMEKIKAGIRTAYKGNDRKIKKQYDYLENAKVNIIKKYNINSIDILDNLNKIA